MFLIGEIGINHSGNVDTAIELIDLAKWAGFDAVKFQKRNPELYPETPYRSPILGDCTYREHKQALELSEDDYRAIDIHCNIKGIPWFASCFDYESVDFIAQFKPDYWKIPSPVAVEDHALAVYIAQQSGYCIMSIGMCNEEEAREAIDLVCKYDKNLCVMHCCSEYPCPVDHVNLNFLHRLRVWQDEDSVCDNIRWSIGYSSHDGGVPCSVAAVAKGAEVIEVHITLDRAMKGSDHAGSLEREEMERLVRHCRAAEKALGSSTKQYYEGEAAIRRKVAK